MVPYFILSGFGALAEELVVLMWGGVDARALFNRAVYPNT